MLLSEKHIIESTIPGQLSVCLCVTMQLKG